jgi:NTE family protein
MAASKVRLAGFAARNDSHPPVPGHDVGAAGIAPSGRMALCLSGGGFRAALFHLGALRRLNELGVLGRIDTVSSVSGGSILAAHLARTVQPWPQPGETFPDWEAKVAMPFRDFVSSNLRTPALLRRLWRWTGSAAVEALADLYEKRLTPQRMGDLPERPRFVFCATDMAYGAPWRFARDWMGDGRIGYAHTPPDLPVAQAVAASSCFPPAFNPLPFRARPEAFVRAGSAAQDDEWRSLVSSGLTLSDGGLYDNLGLDVVWHGHATILMSDGGATFDPSPDRGLFKRLARYLEIQGKEGWDARIQRFNAAHGAGLRGAYWLVGQASHGGYAPDLVDDVVSEVRTDLDAFTPAEIQVLENHGYALAQSRLSRFAPDLVPPLAPEPSPPHPEALDPAFVRRNLSRSHRRAFPLGRFGRGPYSKRFPPSAEPAIRSFTEATPSATTPRGQAPPLRKKAS